MANGQPTYTFLPPTYTHLHSERSGVAYGIRQKFVETVYSQEGFDRKMPVFVVRGWHTVGTRLARAFLESGQFIGHVIGQGRTTLQGL